MEPKQKKVEFEVNLDTVPAECHEIVMKLKEVAEQQLFIWNEDFNTTPPPSFFETGGSQTQPIAFGNIFKVPDFDETGELARDRTGDIVRLDASQLASVRRLGEFDVESRRFPGQRHRWRLNRLIQKGTTNTMNTLQKDAVRGLQLIFVTARNRWFSSGFSLRQSMKGFGKAFVIFADLLIGLPHTNCGDLNLILERELQHFLVCELTVKNHARPQLEEFWDFVERVNNMEPKERYIYNSHELGGLAVTQPPYNFVTPGRVTIDLRLHHRGIFNRCRPVLNNILDNALEGWFFKFRDNWVAELKKSGKNIADIAETVNRTCEKEYFNRLFDLVRNSEQLEGIEPSIGETLTRQARFAIICREADSVWKERQDQEEAGIENEYRHRSPILAQMAPCLRAHKSNALQRFQAENRYTKCEYALRRCEEEGLDQYAYFLSRLLIFWRERVPLLEKQVRATRETFPDDVYTFSRRIWFPKNWEVYQSAYGEMTKVETEVLDHQIVTPGIESEEQHGGLHYIFHKSYKFSSTTRYPFWRWRNFFLRHFVFMMNVMGLLLIKFPFTSRFGARALFTAKPFYPKYTHSSYSRLIYPSDIHKVHTFVSRLIILWRNVRRSRQNFESSDNTGFMDKKVTRHLNRFWNYVLKGACGSILLTLLFPPLLLVLTLGSFILGVTAVVWAPIASLLYHFVVILFIYDCDKPTVRRNAFFPMFEVVIFHFLIRGVGQLILTLITSVIICPIVALFALFWGALRFSVRSLWDVFMFNAIIKRHARVPAKEDWMARRISGPGLASNHFFHAQPEQILAALLAALEREELDLWYANKRLQIAEPMEKFINFMNSTFASFSMDANSRQGVLMRIRDQKDRFYERLFEKKSERAKKLRLEVSMSVRARIKLSMNDLDAVTRSGTKLVETFYYSKILPLLREERSATETSWWQGMNMTTHDFDGLFNRILGEEFGEQVFTPLEETDTYYTLRINHLDLSSYVEMLTEARPRDDLDEATGVLKEPMRLQARLTTPRLALSDFEPNIAASLPDIVRSQPIGRRRHRFRRNMRYRAFKRKFSNRRMADEQPDSLTALAGPIVSVDFNIYHPVLITTLLHKRDRSDHSSANIPLPLDDYFLRAVLDRVVRKSSNFPEHRTASLGSVNPDLVQSATTNSSPQRMIPNMASEPSLSMGTTEDDDDEFDDEDEEHNRPQTDLDDRNNTPRVMIAQVDSQSTLGRGDSLSNV